MTRVADFTHLHVHTEYSMLDGAARNKDLAARAAELGMSALAMTDHGNMYGAYEFYKVVTAAGVKPIIGVEAYVAPGSRFYKKPVFWGSGTRNDEGESDDVSGGGKYTHMTLWARDAGGLSNLFWLTSKASIDGQYPKNKPRMDQELIASRATGIMGSTGCPGGEVQTRLRLGQPDKALEAAAAWRDILGEGNYFLEVMDHGLKVEQRTRAGLLEIGKKLNLPILPTNDSHYVNSADADAHDTLLCVGVGKRKADEKRFRFAGDTYYLKSPQEMRELWDTQIPGACDNTLMLADRVGDYSEVFAHRDLMPRFDVPEGHTQDSWLREEVERGLRERYGDPLTAEVRERAEYELGVISKMGFAAYFLIVSDIVRYAHEHNIAVGPGRGSAAGSIIAYVTRITELDPIRHHLMFERFLNPERVSPPDADLDFEDRRRGELITYITEKYGSDYCSGVVTFGKLKAKAAVKDACRVYDYPYSLGETLSNALPGAAQGYELSLTDVFDPTHEGYERSAPFRKLYEDLPDAKVIVDAARGIEGIVRQSGVHPAGMILSSEPLVDVVPMAMREPDGLMLCGFPYTQAEELGLLKIDFLGLRNLTIMNDVLETLGKRGIVVDLDTLPLDDAPTYEALARGDTLGTFQLDSGGIRSLLRMMKPDRFEDVSAVQALYRPGPMGADSHTNYALRKNGQQPITAIHPELREPLAEILDETYGLIVYQEQVMAIAQKLAGYSLAQADLLRRAMGKKKKAELDRQYDNFHAGMRERGYSDAAVKTLWDLLIPFSDYAFNRCATGETLVTRLGRGSHDWPQTLRNLANRIHGREDYDGSGCRCCHEDRPISPRSHECKACKSWRAKWHMDGGMNAAGRVGDRILPVKITDVFRQGVKPVWKMTLANGMSLTSTANHRHLTPDGWRRLDQLSVGEEVSTMAEGEWGVASPRTDRAGDGKGWGRGHGYTLHGRHAKFVRNTANLARECVQCDSTEGRLERAHLDGDPMNNSVENLAYLCNPCHKRHDYANGGRVKMWRKGRAVLSSPIVSIEYVGEEMTYDVTVDSKDHSWVANGGIVTHNSHSAAYGLLAYRTAWLKTHYPADYMAAVLTSVGDEKGRMAIYLGDCRHLGIKVLPPDVNTSGPRFTATSDTEIRFGLEAVRNVGQGAAAAIVAGRHNGPYESFGDFLDRVGSAACTKRVADALIKSGAFDSMGSPRQGLHFVHEGAVDSASKVSKKAAVGQDSLFREELSDVQVPEFEWDKTTRLQFEREMLGLYVSDHPLSGAEETLKRNRTVSIAELLTESESDDKVTICGVATQVKHAISQKGNAWAKVVLEDLDATVEVLVWGDAYQLHRDDLIGDVVYAIDGRVQHREGSISVIADVIARVKVVTGDDPVKLFVAERELSPALVRELKQILKEHSGKVPLHLYVRNGDKTTVMAVPDHPVEPSPAFAAEIKGLLGAEAIER